MFESVYVLDEFRGLLFIEDFFYVYLNLLMCSFFSIMFRSIIRNEIADFIKRFYCFIFYWILIKNAFIFLYKRRRYFSLYLHIFAITKNSKKNYTILIFFII